MLTGREPIYQNANMETPVMNGTGPRVEYNANINDFGATASGLKDIFDSGDPVLISAIQAGVHAFQTSVKREAHVRQQTEEIDHLKNECDDLKLRISTLENRLMEGDRRKQVRRREDLGSPAGMAERRSGEDRRKIIKTPLNTQGQMLGNRI